jgi:[protein-PII] uridylyltransferase
MSTRERRERSNESDQFLSQLFHNAAQAQGGTHSGKEISLAAVGGYGRGELSPGSDLDIVFLHSGKVSPENLKAFVNEVLYPLWDTKSVDHSVRTRSETREAASADLRVATGLLDIRYIAGNPDLISAVQADALDFWRKNAKENLSNLHNSLEQRHSRAGELAYLLEPDLKEARGGLRDIQALRAISLSGAVQVPLEKISWAEGTLNNVRESLHIASGRGKDRLLFQEQDKVADLLNYPNADAMMSDVARAARSVDYLLNYTWHSLEHKSRDGFGRLSKKARTTSVAKNVSASNREILIDPLVSLDEDPVVGLRAAATAAQLGLPLSLDSFTSLAEKLKKGEGVFTNPWPREARELLIALIGAGESMVDIFETLDQEEIIFHWIPEWMSVRSLPQRNALHRHTVDRHMVETAVHAAKLTRKVQRPDLLLFAALFHDIGKGAQEDHSERGVRLIEPIAQRIGFDSKEIEIVKNLILHHLLLSSTATRRDLDDPATIQSVLTAIPDVNTLELLHALSIADGEATGSAGWSDWKATLVNDLVHRVKRAMAGAEVAPQPEVSDEQSALAQMGQLRVSVQEHSSGLAVEVISPDKPGLLSIVAGVLNISRLDVKSARTKTLGSSAVMTWIVTPEPHAPEINETKLHDLIASALVDSTEVEEKLFARAAAYASIPTIPVPDPEVEIFTDAATDATVIEVRSHDRPGLLFRIGAAITQSKVDIRSAIVTTLGAEAIDTLYVTELTGGALSDERANELASHLKQALK